MVAGCWQASSRRNKPRFVRLAGEAVPKGAASPSVHRPLRTTGSACRDNISCVATRHHESSPVSKLHDSRLMRFIYLSLGLVALLLGVLGLMLPVLPTTPFVLLAAACFARGSERFHRRLLAHRIAGPIVREWQQHRAMPPGVKSWAFALMGLSFGVSLLLVPSAWHRAMLLVIAALLAAFLWRVPVRPGTPPDVE